MTGGTAAGAALSFEDLPADIQALAEQYVGVKVPMINMVMIGVTAAVMVLLAVAGFVFLKKHFARYRNAMVGGILAQLGGWLGYAVVMNLLVGMEPLASVFSGNAPAYYAADLVLMIVIEGLSIYLGFRYFTKMNMRQGITPDVGSAFGFGLALYIASLFASRNMLINSCIEYISYASFMNRIGLSSAVASMGFNGLDAASIAETMDQFVNENWVNIMWTGLINYVWRAVVMTSSAILYYGIGKGSLERRWTACVFGLPVVFYLLIFLGNLGVSSTVCTVLITLAALGSAVMTRILIHKYMPDDEADMKRKAPRQKRNKKQGPPAMPKIVMPED